MNPNDKKSVQSAAAKFLDNLASFLGDDSPSREDLTSDLETNGFDVNQLRSDFRGLLSEHAPTWQQKAERERKAALETLARQEVAAPRARSVVENEINNLIQAMQQLGATVPAGAYHQKFREATDADLESLRDDLALQYQILKKKQTK
jgi:hypothetical protein